MRAERMHSALLLIFSETDSCCERLGVPVRTLAVDCQHISYYAEFESVPGGNGMSKYKNIRKLTIFTLIAVIAVLTVSAVIVAAVIHNNPKNGTIQEATAAYDRYCADQDDADQRTLYMIYHADGGFAALCNGVVRGVYDSEEAAMQAMAGIQNLYRFTADIITVVVAKLKHFIAAFHSK